VTDPITPALTAEEWAAWKEGRGAGETLFLVNVNSGPDDPVWGQSFSAHPPAALIALANAALPDDDPRKITREKLVALRDCLAMAGLANDDRCVSDKEFADARRYDALATTLTDALESYLPPAE
jgi:hypothetical protein